MICGHCALNQLIYYGCCSKNKRCKVTVVWSHVKIEASCLYVSTNTEVSISFTSSSLNAVCLYFIRMASGISLPVDGGYTVWYLTNLDLP